MLRINPTTVWSFPLGLCPSWTTWKLILDHHNRPIHADFNLPITVYQIQITHANQLLCVWSFRGPIFFSYTVDMNLDKPKSDDDDDVCSWRPVGWLVQPERSITWKFLECGSCVRVCVWGVRAWMHLECGAPTTPRTNNKFSGEEREDEERLGYERFSLGEVEITVFVFLAVFLSPFKISRSYFCVGTGSLGAEWRNCFDIKCWSLFSTSNALSTYYPKKNERWKIFEVLLYIRRELTAKAFCQGI